MVKQSLMHVCIATCLTAMLCISYAPSQAQSKKDAKAPTQQPTDTTQKAKVSEKGPVAFSKLIKPNAVKKQGMLTAYIQDGKYYVEIPDSLMGRDILAVSRITKAAAGLRVAMGGYGGDQINSNAVRFEKAPNNKVLLKKISYQEVCDESSDMYESLSNSTLQPIHQAFEAKAISTDGKGVIVDFTDFMNSDSDILYFAPSMKKRYSLGNQQPDKSYILDIRSYPINTEFSATKTYTISTAPQPGQSPAAAAAMADRLPPIVTYELNCSMVLLPKEPMVSRYADPRVGYFAVRQVNFGLNPQGVKNVTLATRWRLEPKDEDLEKYKRGELVEPKKPIVFYIDPATPKKWVPYLIQGVNDWQKAFEQAGFKNAIVAKEAPTNDSTWSLEDARHSAIVYKASDIPNASGPHVNDPRSGEIMESHINWYHNVMKLLRNWYFIQCGATDSGAFAMEYPEELMGELIRFVSSHEVGHTLGLRHNFGSSSTYPTDKLRDIEFLKTNGFAPSIMDYARFNYVAQPEDNIPREQLFPRINHYDKWAIEWGYRYYPQYKSAEESKDYLNRLVIERTSKNPYLWFGHEMNASDPRSQSEDLGDNAMKSSDYGLNNLKKTLPKLMDVAKVPAEGYAALQEMYGEYSNQLIRYIGHVTKNVGGIYETPRSIEENATVYAFVPKARQREALEWINKNIFITPTWLLNEKIFERTGDNGVDVVAKLQRNALDKLLNPRVLKNMVMAEASLGSQAYRTTDYFSDLNRMVWSNLSAPIDIYKRGLQKMYVKRLLALYPAKAAGAQQAAGASSIDEDEQASITYYQLKQLQRNLQTAASTNGDTASKAHLQYLADLIKDRFEK